ncbi:unnamed protein product [Cylicocyclus nassatus]|uniref:Uncharacterized protein n=1 Tax=Cylicocyclus nassatus TaxID=53992 RepID=A0AA36DMT0_CYLNA|nr:unnamed protein product [Cylicocyclus nassatus]
MFQALNLEQHIIAIISSYINLYTYSMIAPLQLCCLLERLVATCCFKFYEKNRMWHLLLLSVPLCTLFTILNSSLKLDFAGSGAFVVLSYYTAQTLVLLLLLYVNRSMTKKYTGLGVRLCMRYQLAENIRAIRVFLPMIVFDTLISLLCATADYLQFNFVFQPKLCQQDPYYLPVYISVVLTSSLLELCEAVVIFIRSPTVRFTRVRNKIAGGKYTPSVVNVFGSDLIFEQTYRNHFDDLSKIWDKPRSRNS